MIGRYVLTALLAGLIAGAVLTGLQVWKLSPLIAAAEVYEKSHAEVHAVAGHTHVDAATEWEPAPGLSRTGFTGAASMLAGGGFALLLAGLAVALNIPINRTNGWMWGACGFFCVHLAPSFGLAPELPGMPVADLLSRQIWWAGTILATGAAIYCLGIRKEFVANVIGVALLAAPHLIGAPQTPHDHSLLPPELAAEFAAKALAAAAIFWLVMGVALGQVLPSIAEKFES